MKRLLTILFLFLSVASFGQIYQAMPQAGYGPVKRMLFDSVLTIPIGIPGLRNIPGGRDVGQIRYVTSDSSIYVYTGTNWVKASSSGGGPSTPDTIVAKYPIRIDTTGVRDTIYLAQAFLDSVYNGTTGFGTGLITAGIVQTDTVINVTPPIVWKRNGTVNTQNVGEAFPITRASTNYFRTDLIYITGADTLSYIQGVESLVNPAAPIVPVDGIVITYVNVFDTLVNASGPPSTYQRTAVVYIDANTGSLATDSVSFNWNQTTKDLTISSLGGSGTRMVVASPTGVLSTQPISSGGTVTSVGLTTGTTGTDINIGAGTSPVTTSGTITLNVPDAGATSRGVVTTGTQTFAGSKTFTSDVTVEDATLGTKFGTSILANSSLYFGNNAIVSLTSGTGNTALGNRAGLFLGSGNSNVFIGYQSSSYRGLGNNNVTIGVSAGNGGLAPGGVGDENTIVGSQNFIRPSSGNRNTSIGFSNFQLCTSSSNNTVIGSGIEMNGFSYTLSDNVILGDGQGNIRFRNTGPSTYLNGNVGIGSFNMGSLTPTASSYLLHIIGTAGATAQYMQGNLEVQNGGNGTNIINAQLNRFSATENRIEGHLTRSTSWSQGDIINLDGDAPTVPTSQAWIPISLQSGTVIRTTGSANNSMISLRPTYNFTGTYSGETIGIDYRPTLTSLNGTSHIALRATSGQVVIGAVTPAASAVVDITSTTQGFLPPRMTGAQAELISSPAEGLMVYSTDGSGTTITSKGWWGYNGTTWVKLN